ncbi:helix-turn-helix domain-containing protein [Nitrososphaera sp.]|uniref:helix-turn-helix domain-containing protein n=1 Tax=Nitrososphaera sp. TaxID=1971748 RepID=UPI00307D4FD9
MSEEEGRLSTTTATATTTKDELTWIAGSVVLSDSPPQQLKMWRKKFGIKQADLAKKMAITPSVLSDYEKGRRPSPGANFIKRYLQALYELAQQEKDGGGSNSGSSSSNSDAKAMAAVAVDGRATASAEAVAQTIAPDAVHINPQ